jgi:UDP-glucose-4-epimerase GalE
MRVFVIGGAGYVGSHFVRYARANGAECAVFDNFSRGHRAAVPKGLDVFEGDLLDTTVLSAALSQFRPDAILHYAAYALVGESVAEPTLYYENNVQGVVSMLKAMEVAQTFVPLVFSSSCAVFGTPQKQPMAEHDPKAPQSPYGRSKLMAEEIIADAARAKNFCALALRYFNACGADASGEIGEDHEPESHLIPNAIKASLTGKQMHVFGNDFPTPDGTCVRDYIHVTDLAEAHLMACRKLMQPAWKEPFTAIHLGTGQGYSNLEVLKTVGAVLGKPVLFSFAERRAGDPAQLVADNKLARSLLEFVPSRSGLHNIIQTAANWHSRHPNGYAK